MTERTLISEEESAALTGVSLSTLLRFADAGYLKVQQEKEGQRFFAKQELCLLFGVTDSKSPQSGSPQSRGDEKQHIRLADSVETIVIDEFARPESDSISDECPEDNINIEDISTSDEVTPHVGVSDSNVSDPNGEHANECEHESPGLSVEHEIEEDEHYIDPVATPADELLTDVLPEDNTSAGTEIQTKKVSSNDTARVATLERVLELQEQLLDEREEKVRALTEEVDWLRSRVEKAEDKADRDQLLLLSETQALSRLITRDQKKSSFQTLLEWVGIAKKENPMSPGTAFEISRTDSSKKP